MQKNDLIYLKDSIFRVLSVSDNSVLVIDCIKRNMPTWIPLPQEHGICTEAELLERANVSIPNEKSLTQSELKVVRQRYTLIAPVLAVVEDLHRRADMIDFVSKKYNVSKPTIRKYLCLYLTFQSIYILAPKTQFKPPKSLSDEQKTFRRALNKYYFTSHQNSLRTAYLFMLKECYCDGNGVLLSDYPPFHRFYYFYQKHKKLQTQFISREGLSYYQRNHRPLLGGGVREFCPTIGYGMVDATICDIYLVNEAGQLVGRPILTACIDAYSSLCMGYSLGWKGGTYSVAQLFQNVIADKVEHCKKLGIEISPDDWNCSALPAVLITDRGREYTGSTLEHLTELGVTITNLDGYRADLKGPVEQFFYVIQNLFKPYLKGKGTIEMDFQERGSHDYRKDACLTLADFEKILVRCILYYNTQRIIESFPYGEQTIKPYANAIWNSAIEQGNLIAVKPDLLYKTLLPRTDAKFTRQGLKVGKLHYRCLGFTEEFLRGDSAVVAYDPSDCSHVYLCRNHEYFCFNLIESAFRGKSLEEAEAMVKQHSDVISSERQNNLQAKLDLANNILAVVEGCTSPTNIAVKGIRSVRQKEVRRHK